MLSIYVSFIFKYILSSILVSNNCHMHACDCSLDKQLYTFTITLISVTKNTIDNKYLVQVLLVNCEKISKV